MATRGITFFYDGCTLLGIPFLKTKKPGHMTTFMWWGGELEGNNNLASYAIKHKI